MQDRQDPARLWGGRGRDKNRLSMLDLLRNNTLDLHLAATLWLLVERKASFIVAASPQLAGKTTMLAAIMDLMPPQYQAITALGRDEDFSFLSETEADSTYILVPELSDHTPAYLWGDSVRTLFEALAQGYSFAATMHADMPHAVIAMLQGFPVFIPDDLIAHLNIVVNMRLIYGEEDMERRLERLTAVVPPWPGEDGPDLLTMATWDADADTFAHKESIESEARLSVILGITPDEYVARLAQLHQTLEGWLSQDVADADALRQLVLQHYKASK